MTARWEGYDLVQPISADQPCGENLEDTPLLASFDAFRLFGQATSPDARQDPRDNDGKRAQAPPEWTAIRNQALAALVKSKDLRLLTHLATASLRTDGLPAFTNALAIAARWLESYWAQAYPPVDEDAILRRNTLNCFADPMAVIDALRRLPLVTSRQHGRFSLRDIDLATGQQQPSNGDVRPDEAQIDAAFAELPLEELQTLQRSASEGLIAIRGIETAMAVNASIDAVPDFSPLKQQLLRIDRVLDAQLRLRGGDERSDQIASPLNESNGGAPASITSRQDAIRALDAVAEFFRRTEPSSPVPLLLDRAKRLVAKNFLEVLADIAPDALTQARAVGGLTPE
jgi:type VI secretion system protein ImpA